MQPQNDDQQPTDSVPGQNQGTPLSTEQRAAVELMRHQIDTIYDDTPAVAQSQNPYTDRTHSETTDHQAAAAHSNDWQQYHSAWQSYYQQYYERYYTAQLQRRATTINPSATVTSDDLAPETTATISETKAVDELRSKLLDDVKHHSHKVRKSRHFMPIIAALTVALVFGILQYNRLMIAQVKAYVSPGAIDAGSIILDPTTNTKVSQAPRVIIPKINVDAPTVYDVPSLEESVVQNKLRDGVVHYPIPGANGLPGESGNTVFLGHSSNDVFDDGDYKFVFVQLDRLVKGDTFYLHYKGTRYTYTVTEKKIINPTQVNELVISSDIPLATLVTCTPPGTALKRLVVIGEQISPDPTKAAPSTATPQSSIPQSISGNSPTLFERLFGGN